MRQAPRKRSGLVAHFIGGTIAQSFVFCNRGGAYPGRGALFWLAPSISGGSGLACAVVPPAHPPTFLGTGGHPLYPRRGLRPLHPAWGRDGGSVFSPSAGCEGRDKVRLLDGWSCCGLRPPSADGLAWPAPLSRPLRPPTFSSTGGHAVPPAGAGTRGAC